MVSFGFGGFATTSVVVERAPLRASAQAEGPGGGREGAAGTHGLTFDQRNAHFPLVLQNCPVALMTSLMPSAQST